MIKLFIFFMAVLIWGFIGGLWTGWNLGQRRAAIELDKILKN